MKNWQIGLLGLIGIGCQEEGIFDDYYREHSERYLSSKITNVENLEQYNRWGIIIVDMQPKFLEEITEREVGRIIINQIKINLS